MSCEMRPTIGITYQMSATLRRFLVDMDGVLFDFNRAVQNLYNVNVEVYGEEIMSYLPGCEHKEHLIYLVIEKGKKEFWSNMMFTPFAYKLMVLLKTYEVPIYICTNPGPFQYSKDGKEKALERIFNRHWGNEWTEFYDREFRERVIFIKDKWLLSSPGTVLIDDFESNCGPFFQRPDGEPSGHAVLVPQSWNCHGYMKADDVIKTVKEQIDNIIKIDLIDNEDVSNQHSLAKEHI